MKTLILTLLIILYSVQWLGCSVYDIDDFSDGAMSSIMENYDGQPY